MTTLQDYLNKKYQTPQEKENIKEIILSDLTESLEGKELDLREFTNLEKVELDQSSLNSPITKISSLKNLKELILPETKPDTPEDKKLFTDLVIEDKTIYLNQQRVVKEIKRLASEFSSQIANKKTNIHFATDKFPQTKLNNNSAISEEDNGE
jgi:hypothetical protein